MMQCSKYIIWDKGLSMCPYQGLRSKCVVAQSDQSSMDSPWVVKCTKFVHMDSKDSDQTVGMHRLI